MVIKKGTSVRQVLPTPIEGIVTEYALDQVTGEIMTKVNWTCTEGHDHSRFFRADEIEELSAK